MPADAADTAAEPAAALGAARRCLLVARSRRGPLVVPVAHWFDGDGVWLIAAADSARVAALGRDPACLLVVAADEGGAGVVAAGRARVLSPADPVRFAVHGPAISGALSALAARNAATVADHALRAPALLGRWARRRRVVVRVALDSLEALEPPSGPTRVTPALPTALPADVRRRLASERVVTVLWDEPPLRAAAATWGSGLTLGFGDARPAARPDGDEPVAVVAGADAGRATEAVGAVLHGALRESDALAARRAVWWRGFDVAHADVAGAVGGVEIPD